jgi:uncharacterized protein (DUF58 family)
MLLGDDLAKVHARIAQIDFKLNRFIASGLIGDYRSIFRGVGVEFEDYREYQYGDDVRAIDWNLTAKYAKPFVRVFREDKELNICVLVDISASILAIQGKQRIIEPLVALALLAIKSGDGFSLTAFSDRIEYFSPLTKSKTQILHALSAFWAIDPKGTKTDINLALSHFKLTQKRKTVLFILSDFLSNAWQPALFNILPKYKVIALHLRAPPVSRVPIGIVPVFDAETKSKVWVPNLPWLRKSQQIQMLQEVNTLPEIQLKHLQKSGLEVISIPSDADVLMALVRYFSIAGNTASGKNNIQ